MGVAINCRDQIISLIRELLVKKETEQTEASGSDLVHDGKSAELDLEKTPKRKMQDDGYGTPDENLVTKPDQEESISSEDAQSYLLQQNESVGPADSNDSAGAISAEGTQVAEEVSSNPGQVDRPASIDDCIIAALQKDFQQKAVASLTVGQEGNEIELFGFKVIIPSEAVKKETKFKMSVDNNPDNYPKNEDALAPILEVSHHLNFDRPVTVKIRTYMSAAMGGTIHARILRRECKAGSTWKHYEDVLIKDQNEVEFKVVHFSKFFLSLIRKMWRSKPVLHYFKDVYIQRGTGTILIMHFQCEKSAKKKQEEVERLDYQKATPVALPAASSVNSQLSVLVECKQPEGVYYNPVLLKVEGFSKRKPYQLLTLDSKKFPEGYEGVFKVSLTVEPSENSTPVDLSINLRALEGSSHSTARVGPEGVKIDITAIKNNHGDRHCDKRQTRIAQYMADGGGVVNSTQNGGSNVPNVDAEQQQG